MTKTPRLISRVVQNIIPFVRRGDYDENPEANL